MRRELTYALAAFTATTVALSTEVRTLSTKTADCSFTSSYDNLPTLTTSQIGTSSVNGQSNTMGVTISASDNIATVPGITWVPTSDSAILLASQGLASEATQTARASSTTKISSSGTTVVQVPTSASEKFMPVSWLSGMLAALALIM
ncbi:uncharacterized protein BDZ83DRAFT_759113 [Colletotrichum acutatum]|uniref:GPI anchored protein n=1 Tax=Glomerella acutata TaxID=27357 RepID=A0AAD8U893_GLOAC|nr:uncharacterized protein BDZ83DRAFT_759113 [Colletotrichum acutatum]KAK1701710.1 hypothetical protein BDZ83DRAFT_759113 [Colletotrichum acutatum]